MQAFDYIIVGKGLIGAAAARYLGRLSKRVAILGADEPKQPETHEGVFSSHYDQRRLTRLSGRTKLWVDLAKRATEQISYIEAESGISFFEPVGVLLARAENLKDKYLESPLETLDAAGVSYTYYPAIDSAWQERFPDYSFPEAHSVLHEAKTAGMINPRNLIKAQLELAKKQGATVMSNEVIQLKEKADRVELKCRDGTSYKAQKVLLCTGAFTNFYELLPSPLALSLKTETVLLAEVSTVDAVRLKTIPTVSYSIIHPDISDIYLTPAVQYEDDKYYFKMGANTFADAFPTNLIDVQAWFQSGDSDVCLPVLQEAIQGIFPKVKFLSFKTKRCIVTRTANGYPMIDQVSKRLFVATGGNGVGAKTSDSLGYLAAGLSFDERWPAEVNREPFKASYL